MPPKAKAAGRGRAPAKRKLAEEFPPGEVLKDTMKKEWKLGAPIGQGGFGVIYLAEENSANPVGADARYVIKVEPIDNGPLFCELAFYMRAAKPDLIQSWMKSKKLKNLGVPRYWGSGRHERGGQRYRFMVIDRLGTDLQKKFEECGRRFPRKLVLQLGLRLLDTLEYIHEHEYVHADVKASNLMLSHSDPNQVYLVDYGLAYRYAPEGLPKEYKEDPKKCHDGTIEFTSIDCHKGASASRRSDLEILSYCMVQWLCGRLPWEDKLQDPLYVRDAKIRYVKLSTEPGCSSQQHVAVYTILQSQENISEFMAKCFSSQDKPDEIQRFMEEVKSLGYTAKPPYDKLRSILQAGLKTIGPKEDGKLEFTSASGAAAPPTKKTTKRKMAADRAEESEVDSSPVKKKRVTKKNDRPKKSPQKTLKSRKVPSSDPKSRLVEMGTQTSPGLAQKSRGRPKKTST
ncbi:serine/threonine-protein kinase VRK1 isoform X4 [Maylandia zebra]|uniref:serine/threonine-protein kinase VRK1 isoform X1 n=1 Tax=Maylandia zebra TaxID=106582 RepID=UPI000329DC23|nr:serine/threonine-protein kinase VRK1 isoform X1 [Maylandia zebra]XP_004564202.1 serine/threonine-protein kinase VRK1 isoform X1 [Maylandia zebra]XP_004564203.1 serine/threonine-protein kinase VRK1 isoform X1 [Maylandia zebra]